MNIAKYAKAIIILIFLTIMSCKSETKLETKTELETPKEKYKFSLAQWSLHEGIFDNKIDPMNFAIDAKKMGFTGLEYVSQLYVGDKVDFPMKNMGIEAILKELKHRSDSLGMENLIIMVDNEGDLSVSDEKERNEAIEKHKKWVDAAAFLNCHSIRINLFGAFEEEEWVENSIKAMKALCVYAKEKNINILVENHGWLSSNGKLVKRVMEGVDMDNCGTLPDFGNFCVKRKDQARWGECEEEYDKYIGMKELMPYAKGASPKSYDFDEAGNETTLDYNKMMQIVEDANFEGYIGVEYEGKEPMQGIKATKALLEKIINKSN